MKSARRHRSASVPWAARSSPVPVAASGPLPATTACVAGEVLHPRGEAVHHPRAGVRRDRRILLHPHLPRDHPRAHRPPREAARRVPKKGETRTAEDKGVAVTAHRAIRHPQEAHPQTNAQSPRAVRAVKVCSTSAMQMSVILSECVSMMMESSVLGGGAHQSSIVIPARTSATTVHTAAKDCSMSVTTKNAHCITPASSIGKMKPVLRLGGVRMWTSPEPHSVKCATVRSIAAAGRGEVMAVEPAVARRAAPREGRKGERMEAPTAECRAACKEVRKGDREVSAVVRAAHRRSSRPQVCRRPVPIRTPSVSTVTLSASTPCTERSQESSVKPVRSRRAASAVSRPQAVPRAPSAPRILSARTTSMGRRGRSDATSTTTATTASMARAAHRVLRAVGVHRRRPPQA